MNDTPAALIPVTVLTGFLGSGKTTLLSALLRHPGMKNVAVLINEFGAVGLDHVLVEKIDGDVVLMQSGCLCCTIRSDLAESLRDLFLKRVRGAVPEFDRVVIETTGLADPAPIIHTLMTDPLVAARYRLDGVVTTVDAVNADDTLDRQIECVKQAAVADRLILTKTDIADAASVERLAKRLRGLNPAAPIIRAAQGAVEPAAILDCGLYDPRTKTADVARWLQAEAYEDHARDHGHDHGHDHDHDHDHAKPDVNRHDASIQAFALTRDAPFTREELGQWLDTLSVYLGPDLLRVKGLLNLDGAPVALHGVQHLFYPLALLKAWPDADRRSKIVFITRDVPRDFVARTLELVGTALAEPAAPVSSSSG
ncbi:MAG: GTP-binding protein [Alphaproteobacteria bacterium]|nr:GTP-binding protein [Alphaproteobacteria bacterium]